MVRLFTWLAIASALSCNPTAHKQNQEISKEAIIQNDKQEKMIQEQKETTTNKQYVIAPDSLDLRASASSESKVLQKIAYGESVQIRQQNTNGKLEIDNIEGTMVTINYQGKEGHAFSGHLSTIPVPDNTIKYRDKMISSYITRLEKAQLYVSDSLAVKNESASVRHLSIPSSSFEETFLIAKILFFIPETYHFPKEDKTVLSTPTNPSEATLNGNYEYVTQSFEIKRKPSGKIQRLSYFNDNEVGGQKIFIEKRKTGFVLIVENFSH